MTKLRTSSLTFIGFSVNSLLEDHPGEWSFDEIYRSIGNRTILDDLAKCYPGETDFSIFGEDSDQLEPLLDVLDECAGGLKGRERRKLNVERCGLNLLMGLILEGIQRID